MKDFKAQIAALQKEQAAVECFMRDYPLARRPDLLVFHNSKLAEFGVVFKAQDLNEVKGLIGEIWNSKGIDVLPLSVCKNGGTTSFLTPYHGRRGDITSVFPVKVDVSQYEVSFEFFALVGDHLTRFSVELGQPSARNIAHVAYWQYRPHTKVDRVQLVAPAFKGYKEVRWWADRTTPNSFTLYWTDAQTLDDIFAE